MTQRNRLIGGLALALAAGAPLATGLASATSSTDGTGGTGGTAATGGTGGTASTGGSGGDAFTPIPAPDYPADSVGPAPLLPDLCDPPCGDTAVCQAGLCTDLYGVEEIGPGGAVTGGNPCPPDNGAP
jgi:hypothetical protein